MHACKYMYLRSVNVLIATNIRVHWRSVKNQQAKETKKRRKQIPSLFSTRSVPSSLLSAAHNRKKFGELKCFGRIIVEMANVNICTCISHYKNKVSELLRI